MREGRINNLQLAMIMVITVIGTSILFAPSLSIGTGGRDAWLSPIPAGLESLFVCFIMIELGKRFPGLTPVEYIQIIVGKWLGTVIGLTIAYFLIQQFAIMLREFTDFTTTVTLTRTPPEIIMLLMLAVVYYGVQRGIEVLARVTQLVVLVELTQLVVSVVVLAAKDIQPDNLFPLFESGPMPLVRGSLVNMVWCGELVIIGFLLPSMRSIDSSNKKLKFTSIYATSSITILLLVSNMFTLGVFGSTVAGRLQYGLYEVARYVSLANFLERLDPIVMGVWIMLIYCKLAIFCFISSLALSQVLRLRDYRVVTGLVCLVGAIMSQHMFPYQASMAKFISIVEPPYCILLELGAPFLLLILAMIRMKKVRT